MKKTLLITVGIAISFSIFAQNVIPQKYTYNLPNKFEEWEVAPGGMLLVGNKDGFSGIDAHTSQISYTYTELGKIKPEEMDVIYGFPWVVLQQGGITSIKSQRVILDYITGEPIFKSNDYKWTKPLGYHLILEKAQIILWGANERSNTSLGIYDISSKTELAYFDLGDKKQGGGYPGWDNMTFINDKLFIPTTKSLMCLNLETLKFDWISNKISAKVLGQRYYIDTESNSTFVYQNMPKSKIYRIDNSTGELIWKKPISLKGAGEELVKINGDLWVRSTNPKDFEINIYDIETAQKKWKKSFKEKGAVGAYIFTENSFIYGTNLGLVNTLNFDGTKTLKKGIKTGAGFRAFELTENGDLFYLTSEKMGIANLQDGGFVKNPAKFKKVINMITTYDDQNDRFIVCTGNEVFFIDKDGNSTKVADIEFKGGETPTKIEFREGGILLSSDQNAMLLDYNGSTKYSIFYKAPGKSVAGKILAASAGIAAAGMGAASAVQAGGMAYNRGASGVYSPKSYTEASYEKSASNFGGVAGSAFSEMGKRFNATQATKDHLYILTKLDDGIGLVKINKDNGEKEGEIILKDKKPEYKIDEDFGAFYYLKSDKEIYGYDLR